MSHLRILSALLAALCIAGAHATITQRLDSIFESRYPEGLEAPGAAVAIALGDSILYQRCFGAADVYTGRPIDEKTLFNIASVSKQFTVVALLKQDVDIDRPAADFFDFPQPFWQRVALRHLASHTSGIPDTRDRSSRARCIYADDNSSAAYFPLVDSLQFEPGTAYDYLNPSFILLARVVEQRTGSEFTRWMADNVFAPAGMTSAVYFSPYSMPAEAAHAYVPRPGGGWNEYDYGEETFFATRPDGGIYASIGDMLAWEQALSSGKILSPTLLAEAYTPQVDVASSPWCDYQRRPNTHYGLGWFIDTTPGRPVKVYHTGDNGGFQAYVAKYPDLGLRIIVLENRNDSDRWQMATAIDDVIFDELFPSDYK